MKAEIEQNGRIGVKDGKDVLGPCLSLEAESEKEKQLLQLHRFSNDPKQTCFVIPVYVLMAMIIEKKDKNLMDIRG